MPVWWLGLAWFSQKSRCSMVEESMLTWWGDWGGAPAGGTGSRGGSGIGQTGRRGFDLSKCFGGGASSSSGINLMAWLKMWMICVLWFLSSLFLFYSMLFSHFFNFFKVLLFSCSDVVGFDQFCFPPVLELPCRTRKLLVYFTFVDLNWQTSRSNFFFLLLNVVAINDSHCLIFLKEVVADFCAPLCSDPIYRDGFANLY